MSDELDKLLSELETVKKTFFDDVASVKKSADLDNYRIKYLGRKGLISEYFKKIGSLQPEERPGFGNSLNSLKKQFEDTLDELAQELDSAGQEQSDDFDLTLPGVFPDIGYRNPLMIILDEIKEIFLNMGFSIKSGPLIEDDYYNFTALNVPEDHPSKDLQDTFYLEDNFLLRTHTSPVQIRTMQNQKPPIRIIAPGRCFRKDTPDATHTPEFHQVEGLVVGENISLAHLKGTLMVFAKKLFGEKTSVRFRPHFFPFTEPSAEMDVYFDEKLGWIEILGAGMVHPNVLEGVGIDSEKYTGFAFGMGVERIAMQKYQINDIRHFYDNDMRFLQQF